MSTLLLYPEEAYDMAIDFARDCARDILQALRAKGSDLTLLNEFLMVRNKVIESLKATKGQNGNFLVFAHGKPNEIVGSDGACLLDKTDCSLFGGKVCYLFACHSFSIFGSSAISEGVEALIGFRERFWVPYYFREDLKRCCTEGILAYLLGKCNLKDIKSITFSRFQDAERSLLDEPKNRDGAPFLAISHFPLNLAELQFYFR